MILLDESRAEIGKVIPESMGLTLEERGGSMTLEIPPDAPDISLRYWMIDDGVPDGTAWRVKSMESTFQTRERSVSLEHAICTLKDTVLFGTHTASDMSGGSDVVDAGRAIEYVLEHQSMWQLGRCDYREVLEEFEFTGTTCFEAIETVCTVCEDAEWKYDFSTFPFTLNVVHRETDTGAEMRMSRNISTIRWSIDRSGMYTRLFPIGEDDLHLTGNYVSANENLWGVICKIETESSIGTEAKLRQWALQRLQKHCNPVVSGTITGFDLSAATGEPLDHIRVGKVCRCPLPEHGTVITERIVKLQWKDRIGKPEEVTVTLSNAVADLASIIKNSTESSTVSGSKGAKSAKKAGEDHAWFVDTESHVAMVAEAVAGPGASQDWSRVSEIYAGGEGIYSRVIRAEGDIVTAFSLIEQTESYLRSTIADTASGLSSRIEQTATYIRAEVSDTANGLSSRIEETATYIRAEVSDTANGLSSRITQTASQIEAVVETANGLSSRIDQTASQIQALVETANGLSSRITQTASQIEAVVETANGLSSRITQTASQIEAVVETANGLSSRIDQTASQIEAVVETANGLSSRITQTASEIRAEVQNLTIDADHVNVTGTVKLDDVMTVTSGTVQITKPTMFVTTSGGSVSINNGKVTADTLQSDALTLVGSGDGDYATLEFGDIANMIRKAEVDGSTNTLKLWKLSDPDATPSINFSKATTLTGAWSSADSSWTVTASPQGNTDKVIIGSKNKNTVGLIREGSEQWISGAEYVHNQYNYGWAAAYAKVSLPGSNTGSATMTVETPASTVDGAANSTTYTVRSTQNEAYITIYAADGETIVRNCAKVTHGQYTAGQNSVGLNVTVNSSNNVPYNAVITPNKNSSATQSVTVTVSPGSLNTTTGKRTIKAMVGTTVADQEDITDYLVGKQNADVALNTLAWNTVSELSDTRTLIIGAYNTSNSSHSASTEKPLFITSDANVAYIRETSASGTAVAQVTHNQRLIGYRAGWAAAYGKVSLPGSNESTATMSVSTPPSATDGNATTTTYTVRSTKNDAYITVYANDGQTIVRNCAKVNHGQYNAGWAAAYAKVSLPEPNTGSATMTVKTPTSTVDGNANSTTYTVRSTQNDAYISVYSGETLVMNCAKVNHGQYNAGWAAAYAKVAWPGANVSSKSMTLKAPASTVGQQESETYSLRVTANEAYITVYGNDGETIVKNCAKVTHNQYNTGWYVGWNDYFDGNYGGAGQWSPATQYGHTWQSDGSNNTVSGNHYVTIPGKYSNGSYTTWYPLLCVEDEATYLGYAKGSLSIDDIYATNSPPSGTTATNLARQLQTAYQDGYDFVTFRVNFGDTHKRYNIEMW